MHKMVTAVPAAHDKDQLQAYSPNLSFSRLTPGIDNIRYDVFLSPRWRELASRVLFQQMLFHGQPSLRELQADEPRSRLANLEEFRRRSATLLLETLSQAKAENSIEVDLLGRVALYKWLTGEMRRQFGEVAVVCKECIEKKGRYRTQDDMWQFSMRSRLSEYQMNRRAVLRAAGETLFGFFEELEERKLRPERRALFGTDFSDTYQVLSSRLLFMENPYDSPGYLEHYIMLGRRDGDAGHVDLARESLVNFLREEGFLRPDEDGLAGLDQQRKETLAELEGVSARLREVQGQLERPAKPKGRVSRTLGLLGEQKEATPGPAELESSSRTLQARQEELSARIETLQEKIEFTRQEGKNRLQELLSFPGNAERLFGPVGPTSGPAEGSPAQKERRQKLYEMLEKAGTCSYILASYQMRALYKDFCPPLNPHQLKCALVEKSSWKELEAATRQFPARSFPMEKLAKLAGWVRRSRFKEAEPYLARFVRDFMRLQQDFQHYNLLSALMERIHLMEDERSRQVSRMNHSLYSCVLPEEREAGDERVVNHVIVKADIRDSTLLTEQLVERGLNPATHFSQHFFEPVRKLMARYNAVKIFLEGDALILGIFENDTGRSAQRSLALACLLAKEVVVLTQAYNRRAAANDLPVLEMGLGIAFQGGSPHYWTDGESQVMISPAINLSDRLSSCSRVGRVLMSGQKTLYNCYLFEGPATVYSGEDKEGTLIRYNVMGVMLNEPGFRRLLSEISLESTHSEMLLFGEPGDQWFHWGLVPIGEHFEKLLIREARVPLLDLTDPNSPRVSGWTDRRYYEVCVEPALYDSFPPKS